MTFNIGRGKPQPIDFEIDGEKLFIRKLPFGLGFRLQAVSEDVPADLVAEIVATCIVNEQGNPLLSIDQVLELDMEPIMRLFSEVSGYSVELEEAEKN